MVGWVCLQLQIESSLGKEEYRSMSNILVQAGRHRFDSTTPISIFRAPSVRTQTHREADTNRMAHLTPSRSHHGQDSFSHRRLPLHCLSLNPIRKLIQELVYRARYLSSL